MIELVLPYPVSANRYWRNYRGIVVPSKEAISYKREVAKIARAAGLQHELSGRIELRYMLYPARPKNWQKRADKDTDGWDDSVRCIDLDNAQKIVIDALQGVVFKNDKSIRRISGRRETPDEKGARIEVIVFGSVGCTGMSESCTKAVREKALSGELLHTKNRTGIMSGRLYRTR